MGAVPFERFVRLLVKEVGRGERWIESTRTCVGVFHGLDYSREENERWYGWGWRGRGVFLSLSSMRVGESALVLVDR